LDLSFDRLLMMIQVNLSEMVDIEITIDTFIRILLATAILRCDCK